jgi:4-amino-4-deoxy-L-arabinose transferase-like glycosyltransferase
MEMARFNIGTGLCPFEEIKRGRSLSSAWLAYHMRLLRVSLLELWVPNTRLRRAVPWLIAAPLLGVGIAIRIINAFQFRMLWGFDAKPNWMYIKALRDSWELPAPDAFWASSHPPLFYYLCAAFSRVFDQADRDWIVIALRLISSAIGLVVIALTIALIRRVDPEDRRRALIAGGLLLYLPVQIYMSAMLSEEILASTLISLVVVGVGWHFPDTRPPRRVAGHVAVLGVIAGLALLTKLTGVSVMFAAAGAYLIDGWRRGTLQRAVGLAALLAIITGLVGGWYYARNLLGWGYLYPYGLEAHKIMFTMPPGERFISDFFRLPLAIWVDPQVLAPDLLHSIWGSTYITLWFDGHRHFLPTQSSHVTLAGRVILLLAIVPTAAFLVGAARGVRRATRASQGPDTIFSLLIAITLAGYCWFVWRNPWFVVLKASFMLGLSVPFAYYASEVLSGWTRRGRLPAALTWTVLAALVLSITLTFTSSRLFWNSDHMRKPGIRWEGEPSRMELMEEIGNSSGVLTRSDKSLQLNRSTQHHLF